MISGFRCGVLLKRDLRSFGDFTLCISTFREWVTYGTGKVCPEASATYYQSHTCANITEKSQDIFL